MRPRFRQFSNRDTICVILERMVFRFMHAKYSIFSAIGVVLRVRIRKIVHGEIDRIDDAQKEMIYEPQ